MATIRDVARLAGVAPMNVSRVINKGGYVSDEIRLRVGLNLPLLPFGATLFVICNNLF